MDGPFVPVRPFSYFDPYYFFTKSLVNILGAGPSGFSSQNSIGLSISQQEMWSGSMEVGNFRRREFVLGVQSELQFPLC